MYCPTCGEQSTGGLRYCKRCGASLVAPAGVIPGKFPLALTTLFLLILGTVTMIGLLAPLKEVSFLRSIFNPSETLVILFGGWTVTLLIDGMLIWLLLRLIGVAQQFMGKRERSMPEERVPEQIAGPPKSIGSVTENTTRSFKHAPYERFDKD
jgi:hypothetical protein